MSIDPKTITLESVKEISMVSHYVFMRYNDYWYWDLLRISAHWTSYQRTNFATEEVRNEWSYKTDGQDRETAWRELVEDVLQLFRSTKEHSMMTDTSDFNIRLSLMDGSHLDMEFSGSFASNDLNELAYRFKNLIPKTEFVYPDVLDVIPLFLEKIPLTKEVLQNIDMSRVCAFMHAGSGAMGAPGAFSLLDVDGMYFYSQSIDGDHITAGEVIDLLFKGADFMVPSGTDMMNFGGGRERWEYVNLGMGNHLFLRFDFWYEHGDRLCFADPAKRYWNWNRLIRDI